MSFPETRGQNKQRKSSNTQRTELEMQMNNMEGVHARLLDSSLWEEAVLQVLPQLRRLEHLCRKPSHDRDPKDQSRHEHLCRNPSHNSDPKDQARHDIPIYLTLL